MMKLLWVLGATTALFGGTNASALAQRDWDSRGHETHDRWDDRRDNNWRDASWQRDNRGQNEYRRDRRELEMEIERLQRVQQEIDRKLAELHNDHRRRDYRETRRDEEQLERLRAERQRINREIEQDRRELREDRNDGGWNRRDSYRDRWDNNRWDNDRNRVYRR
jgi:chromosome segregation ATPase